MTQSETYSSRPWRVSVFLALLRGDHGRQVSLLQPAKQAAQFGAQDALIGETGEQRLERVQANTFRPNGVHRVLQTDEQSLEIVIPRLLNLARLDIHVVEEKLLAFDQIFQIEAQRGNIPLHFLRRLFKCHQDARLIKLLSSTNQEFHAQHGLAAAGSSANDGRSPSRQATPADFVESVDSRRCLRQRGDRGFPVQGHLQVDSF